MQRIPCINRTDYRISPRSLSDPVLYSSESPVPLQRTPGETSTVAGSNEDAPTPPPFA